ncbi:hypothetical protein [Actinacidiphila sp. bgisy167]|uniref:hypothetical protein n=1 Tax=Actinacidiphila sp. bgisy167 TaxID=3413797 RepID=UPI003D74D44E
MPFEDELGAALRRTGDGFSTDSRALAAAGLARGRRTRRRRAVAFAGSAAAVAALGVGAALVAPGEGVRSTGAAATVADTDTDRGWGPETASDRKMLALFAGLLPKGRIISGHAAGTRPGVDMFPRAEVVWDDGHGASTIAVGLSRAATGPEEARCPDLAMMREGSACTRTESRDGSVLVVVKTWEYQDEREGPRNWRAVLTTLEGLQIEVQEWNAPAQKGEPTTRDEPPLNEARLAALVRAPEWKPLLATLPDPSAPPEQPGTGEPSGGEILERLKAVMPPGLKITELVGEDGYAHITVDDGRGATLVEVNVQRWRPEEAGALRFENPTTLPDGTEVDARKGPGDKGGAGIQRWTADTFRPDGLRVVIGELNSGGYHRPPTRTAPALSMDALVKAATDPRWKELG